MVLNIALLDGATIEHENVFYTLLVDENGRLEVKELLTGIAVRGSEKEHAIIQAVFAQISVQSIDS